MILLGISTQAHVIDVCLHLSPAGAVPEQGVCVSGYIGFFASTPERVHGDSRHRRA